MKALQIAATGMAAQQMKVDVVSNNLANMSTTGYNPRRADFADLTYQQMARPGSVSSADGSMLPTGIQIGLWQPTDPLSLRHQSGTLFSASDMEPAEGATVLQGMLEDSNVEPVSEIARMIEVQRAYELGQKFLDAEDERVRGVISTLGR